MILPSPALRTLLSLKLAGNLRKQLRRVRSAKGALFALLGVLALAAWLVGFFYSDRHNPLRRFRPGELELGVQLGAGLFTLLTVLGAFSHRGLYLPREEIERLFSSPISRADLVRYRLLVSTLRSLLGALFVAFVFARRSAHPLYAGVGTMVAMAYLPLVGQGASLLLGSAENRLARALSRLPLRALAFGLFLAGMGLFAGLYWGFDQADEILSREGLRSHLSRLRPFAQRATLPFRPFGALVGATDGRTFALWLGILAPLWVVCFEALARARIDFRELSLDTSADVAKRLRRYRAVGGWSAAMEISDQAAGLRVPWLFGRGPFGAVAWRKCASLARKARGALLLSSGVLALLVWSSRSLQFAERGETTWVGSLFVAGLGTTYLCLGLRFDFREDLERMEQLKVWPLAPSKLFTATLLPEVLLVSALITAALAARGLWLGSFEPLSALIMALVPLGVWCWAAIDNAVYLWAPTKPTPGQEGALHHTGRALVLMFLRALALALVLGAVWGLTWLALRLGERLEWSPRAALGLAAAASLAFLLVAAWGLARLGGWLFARFDVARDRI